MTGLAGKVALITGAGGMKGIGRATAIKLAAQGADIAVTDVHRAPETLPPGEVRQKWRSIESVSDEIRALGRSCFPVWCDLGHSEQIQAMVEQVVDKFGHIDILVNNARAISGRDKMPITELPEEVWQHYLTINTTAVYLCTKYVARVMIPQHRGGRIINIASDRSKQARANSTAYSASKFAVLGITQAAALDLALHKITVNAVCPSMVNTERFSYWDRSQAEARGLSMEDFQAEVNARAAEATPLGRIAVPEDVANLVAFLASEEASFITGQAYNVNGGLLFH